MRHRYSFPFLEPVDWKDLELDDYPLVIKNPIDLGTIKQKLDEKKYWADPTQFLRDLTLMFDNCYHYNEPTSDVSDMGYQLQKIFIQYLQSSSLFTPEQIKSVKDVHPKMYESFHKERAKEMDESSDAEQEKDKKKGIKRSAEMLRRMRQQERTRIQWSSW